MHFSKRPNGHKIQYCSYKILRANRKRLKFRKPTRNPDFLGGLSNFQAFRSNSISRTLFVLSFKLSKKLWNPCSVTNTLVPFCYCCGMKPRFRSGSIPFCYIDEIKPKQIRVSSFLSKNRGWVATSGFLSIIIDI